MHPKTARKILKAWGWTMVGGLPEEDKCILLGGPHTSILDFWVATLFYTAIGGKARCMVKKELFFPPLGWLLRSFGAFPVDRKNPTAMLRGVIEEMDKSGHFHLAIAPEGTRKPIKRWKTGFHYIARKTGIPVYMGFFDWKTKRVGCGRKVELTDDAAADMKRIQQLYEDMHLEGRHPENYVTH